MTKHKGVDVNHPAIVRSIKQMHNEGRSREDIIRLVGMPAEVVRKHSEAADKEKEINK